jgi:hypothetical protein
MVLKFSYLDFQASEPNCSVSIYECEQLRSPHLTISKNEMSECPGVCVSERSDFLNLSEENRDAGRSRRLSSGTRIPSPPRIRHVFFLPGAQSCSVAFRELRTIKKLGYVVGKHMNVYGEHMKLVSDPFDEGDCVAVHAISSSNPTVRTIELPVSLLAGWEDLFQEVAIPTTSDSPRKSSRP